VNALEDARWRHPGSASSAERQATAFVISGASHHSIISSAADSADEILGRPAFPYARTKTDVELAVLSAADLGVGSDQASLAEVYQRARQAGFELCPAEVGPQLRLDYRNQPLGEALDIAMEPVATYRGDPTILTLVNWGTGLMLVGRDGRPESMVFRKSRFVFAVPTKGRLEAVRGPQIVPTSAE
jgi:hypothetical protein